MLVNRISFILAFSMQDYTINISSSPNGHLLTFPHMKELRENLEALSLGFTLVYIQIYLILPEPPVPDQNQSR